MKLRRQAYAAVLGGCLALFETSLLQAQDLGPFMPHDGAEMTTAWTNSYGPDAESWMRLSKVNSQSSDINYSSSRGTVAVRRVRMADRASARTMVLGFGSKMPLVIANTTALGTSTAVMESLRSTGVADVSLIYNDALATMPGRFKLVESRVMLPVQVGNQVTNVPAMHVTGAFGDRKKKAAGDFYFLDNKNNPVLIQYTVQFTGEKSPRTERIVRVSAGPSQLSAMEQSLATMRTYDLYGMHFDFGKATIRSETAALLDEIAVTLKSNPLWTLRIVGHTDSIGDPNFNLKLSKQRSDAIKTALVKRGIEARRLETAGAGQDQPKASNKTLQGRALNRRVELTRTDR